MGQTNVNTDDTSVEKTGCHIVIHVMQKLIIFLHSLVNLESAAVYFRWIESDGSYSIAAVTERKAEWIP